MTTLQTLAITGAFLAAGPLVAADLASATNATGLRLYSHMAPQDTCADAVLSPYAIELAMAMASDGASGDTRSEIVAALGLPQSAVETRFEAAGLRQKVGLGLAGAEWKEGSALFLQQGLALAPDFEKGLQSGFDAEVRPVRFADDPAGSATSINRWASDVTRGHIVHLVSTLTPDTRLVLANAIYLKAEWREPFKAENTRPLPFHRPGYPDTRVPTMSQTEFIGYRKGPDYQAVALTYVGTNLQMVILLPDTIAGAPTLARQLTAADLADFEGLERREADVHLLLPRFRADPVPLDLAASFKALGIHRAFDPSRAEFDAMLAGGSSHLAIGHILHQAYVQVDEQGTVAAAATGIELRAFAVRAGQKRPIEFRVDHPFVFLIQDRTTGVCLFLGSVANPISP